jgi:hypothetical protein
MRTAASIAVCAVASAVALVFGPATDSQPRAGVVAPPYMVAYSTPNGSGQDGAALFALRADGSGRLQLTNGDSA